MVRPRVRTVLAGLLVLALPIGAEAQHDSASACGPRLLQRGEPLELQWRLRSITDPRHRYGFRTPVDEGRPCTSATARSTGEVRLGGGIKGGETRFATNRAFARPLKDESLPYLEARYWYSPNRHAAFAFAGSTLGTAAELDEISVVLVGGPLYGWFGRRAVGYGLGASGSIVLSGDVPLDGVGIGVREPFRLPWLLKWLGQWDIEGVVARASDNGPIGNPFFGAARGTWAPWPGTITFGTSRAAMFNGEGAPGLTWRRLWSTIIGSHLLEDGKRLQFNNQLMTLDAVIRARIAGLPFAVYAELGAEDSAGAWVESPSLVGGIEFAHPAEGWIVGLSQAYMHPRNGHGYFYRHSLYTAGWSDDGRGLGHPLAGPGREWTVHGTSIDMDGSRWDVDAGVFVRDRYEGTSMGPDWVGQAIGGRLSGRVDVGAVDLYVDMEGEHHEDGHGLLVGSMGIRWTTGPIR